MKKKNSYLASDGKFLWKSSTGPAGEQTKSKLENFSFPSHTWGTRPSLPSPDWIQSSLAPSRYWKKWERGWVWKLPSMREGVEKQMGNLEKWTVKYQGNRSQSREKEAF